MTPQNKAQPEAKLPGQIDPDFSKVVADYLDRFHSITHLDKRKFDPKELYAWCSQMGEKYKDWFVYEGGARDNVWAVQIRKPKHTTFFRLRWNDAIVKTWNKHEEPDDIL